jgi:hypothetical protein
MHWRHDVPKAEVRWWSLIPGIAGALCASASLFAKACHGRLAWFEVNAAATHSISKAYHLATLADWWGAANFVLGLSAISLGLTVLGQGDGSSLVRGLASYSLVVGGLSVAAGMLFIA